MGQPKIGETSQPLSRSQRSLRPVHRLAKADYSVLQPGENVQKRTFAEDFLFEHSVLGMQVMKIEIPNGHLRASNEKSECCQQFGFPS
jgi:hypothetical protein